MHQSTLLQLIFIVIFIKSTVNLVECRPRFLSKRNNAETNPINLESADSDSTKDVSFDDYPLVVPKRAAMLLDRLMVALHHALEDDGGSPRKINEVYRDGSFYATTQTMGNQQEKGKLRQSHRHHIPRTSALVQQRTNHKNTQQNQNHHDVRVPNPQNTNNNNDNEKIKNILSVLQPNNSPFSKTASELTRTPALLPDGAAEFSPTYDSENGQNPGIAEEPENIEGGITGLPPGHFAVSGAELLLNDNENNGEDRTINVRNNNGQHEQHHSHHHPGVVDDTVRRDVNLILYKWTYNEEVTELTVLAQTKVVFTGDVTSMQLLAFEDVILQT
uniref:CSON011912 protein n=1 Tax=Culicoides sonorensis TaxID=179676 RepID=A0A336M9M6_CULSO